MATLGQITERTITGLWLLLLYPALLWTVIAILCAYGFQENVAKGTDSDNNPLTISFVMRKADELRKIEANEQDLKNSIKKLEQEFKKAKVALFDAHEYSVSVNEDSIEFVSIKKPIVRGLYNQHQVELPL